MTDLAARIAAYLSGGGLFNPELANHDAVCDLIIDCRTRIEELENKKLWCDDVVLRLYEQIEELERSQRELEKALEPWTGLDFLVREKPDDFVALEVKHNGETKVLVTAAQIRTAARALKGEG